MRKHLIHSRFSLSIFCTLYLFSLGGQETQAQSINSFQNNLYLSASIGAGLFQDDINYSDTDLGSVTEEFDVGLQTQAAIGYQISDRFRAEAEFFYRRNESDIISIDATAINASNTFTSLGGMLNAYIDLPNGRFAPYIGVGLGVVKHDLDAFEHSSGISGNLDDIELAYQLMLGTNYRMTHTIDLFGEYRYFGSTNPSVDTSDGSAIEIDYQTHNFLMGLRYRF